MQRNGQNYYFHADGLGSIIAITDASGQKVQSYSYDSFGNITAQQNTTFIQPFAYTARIWDAEIGLYDYRLRTYDPVLGKFISKDPLSFGGGDTNLYRYVGNGSPNYTDPWGLTRIAPISQSPWYVYSLNTQASAVIGAIRGIQPNYRPPTTIVAPGSARYSEHELTQMRAYYRSISNSQCQSGVYNFASQGRDPYIGQSVNFLYRANQHTHGTLRGQDISDAVFYAMPGSSRTEREVYEQYLISKHGLGNIQNSRNPMGGRMNEFDRMIEDVINKYNLPRFP